MDLSDSEKCRQCPERITGVSGDEPWQHVGVAAGADPQETDQGNQNNLDQGITSSSNHGLRLETSRD